MQRRRLKSVCWTRRPSLQVPPVQSHDSETQAWLPVSDFPLVLFSDLSVLCSLTCCPAQRQMRQCVALLNAVAFQRYSDRFTLKSLCLKNVPPLTCYEYHVYRRILILRKLATKWYFIFSHLIGLMILHYLERTKTRQCVFSLSAVLLVCQSSTSWCLISSILLTCLSRLRCCMTA